MQRQNKQAFHEKEQKSLSNRLADLWYEELPPPPLVRAYIPPAPFTNPNPLFKSADEAGKAAALAANPESQKQGGEFGGRVFKINDNLYSYTGPFTQSQFGTVNVDAGVTGSGRNKDYKHPTIPVGATDAGSYHTHPAGGPLGDRFSYGDADSADLEKVPAYLATPAGRILKYDPKTGKQSVLKEVSSARRER